MASKWNGDATSAEKLLLLFVTMLFNPRSFSLGELSSSLNASKTTVLRLLRQLESSGAGLVIREKRGRELWCRLKRGDAPACAVNPDEIARLALCREFALPLLPENLRGETAMTLAKLGAPSVGPAIAGSFAKGWIDYGPFEEIFSTLEKAARERLVCRISYMAAGKDAPREHFFTPQRFLASHEAIYVQGWLLQDENPERIKYGDPLRLPLQRFKSCELAGFSAERLPLIPPGRNDALGFMTGEAFTARIRFAPAVALYVSERIWSENQKLERHEDGSVTLEVKFANMYEGVSWVLGFGSNAVVREPAWFARAVRNELRLAARNYRKPRADNENKSAGSDEVAGSDESKKPVEEDK